MKEYFIRLFEYDRYANLIILETILKANNPEKPIKLMAHLLTAQQVWLTRCKGLAPEGGTIWPNWQAETFSGALAGNSEVWIKYLKELRPIDFENTVRYKNLQGEDFENKLSDILAHVINHGTHHRAQAGQHLIAAGIEKLPPTDFIFLCKRIELGASVSFG